MNLELDTSVAGYERASSRSPERTLATSILSLAVADLKSKSPSVAAAARTFFESADSTLEFWCELLDLDADIVRERALGALPIRPGIHNTLPVDNAEKRQAVREALAQTPTATLVDVAKRCGCSQYLAGKIRSEMRDESQMAMF